LIETDSVEILGSETVRRFDGQLPFLFKVLAAAKPLSIQAHPNQIWAKKGYAREEALGMPFDAPERNYKDRQHKPECICALTDFWGLCGFRKINAMAGLLQRLCPATLKNDLDVLRKETPQIALQTFFKRLMGCSTQERTEIVSEACDRAGRFHTDGSTFEWVLKLNEAYPSDIGVIFPAILNLIHLKPGQALYLQPGDLHAYLEGVGIELMANSDNVLRGGLTPKYIDVDELIRVLIFEEKRVDILEPEPRSDGSGVYRTPAREFELSVISLTNGADYQSPDLRNVEILLCTQGHHTITQTGKAEVKQFCKGQSILIPAAVSGYVIQGQGTIYKASVP
jgi:mannose-6-phosphate isomerase